MHMRKNAAFAMGSCAATVNVLKRECDITEAWRGYQWILYRPRARLAIQKIMAI